MRTTRSFFAVTLALCLVHAAVHARTVTIPHAEPESVGFSSERLQLIDATMKALVDARQLPGVITAVTRNGQLVQQTVYGKQDLASGRPMQKDTIFRIYSMTKPITGVAMMILYEEGKWRPSDPIARHIPQFKGLKVFKSLAADGTPVLEEPAHAPTVGELMSHTAGFTYGVFGNSPVDKMYMQANLLQSASLQEFVGKVAKIPLAYQPGEAWMYSVSVDIQGYLVEKLSGKPLAEFLRERLFEPLGMRDTAFFVPKEKMSRLATVYSWRGDALASMPHDPAVNAPPGMASGGGGLYSTIDDYLRFAQMLANGGELAGVRILAPSSVALMTMDHVPDALQNQNGKFGIGEYRMRPGFGFGYDVAVYEDPARLGSTAGKGTYLWDGIAGTWFWIDPTNHVVFVGMMQRWLSPPMPLPMNIEELSRTLTMQALTDPSK